MKKKRYTMITISIVLIAVLIFCINIYINNKADHKEASVSNSLNMTETTSGSITPKVTAAGTNSAAAVTDTAKLPEAAATPEAVFIPETIELTDTADADFSEGIRITKYPEDYACFKFETPDGFLIVSDPYAMNETVHPDIVTESHQDADHVDTSCLESPYELITEPGEYVFDKAMIRGFSGRHNKGSTYPNNIFVITLNEITVAHFASQGEVPSDDILEQIGPVDILLIQAFTNPNYNKLVLPDLDGIIDKLNPKIIIPEHCGADGGSLFANRLKVPEEISDTGSIVITKSILEESDGIRVISLDNSY